MGLIIAKQSEIEKYFESEALNQSSLKDLGQGLDYYKAQIEKRKDTSKPTPEYFLIGGAVDTILTAEEGVFEDKYYVSELDKKPSDKEILIIESVFDELDGNDLLNDVTFEDSFDAIIAAADEFEWQGRWKTQTRYEKLVLAGTEYFEDLKNSKGKLVLSAEQKATIDRIVMSLTTNERTKRYFDRQVHKNETDYDVYYQLPIYFEYEGIECKAMLDIVIVIKDFEGKIKSIIPIDLKTMSGNTLQFIGKVKQHRYDIQAAWYKLALTKYFEVSSDIIKNFRFVVESTTNQGIPLVYELSDETLLHGYKGSQAGLFYSDEGFRDIYYSEVKGYHQLIQEYKYYEKNGWETDKRVKDIITLDYLKGILQ